MKVYEVTRVYGAFTEHMWETLNKGILSDNVRVNTFSKSASAYKIYPVYYLKMCLLTPI